MAGPIWAYCRVSTTKDEQEESLDAQVAWAEKFARDRGSEMHIVREQASAKTTVGRPRFNQMMAELAELSKSQRPEYLIVTALDRLSRSTRDTLNVIEALRELKITLYQRGLGPITAEEFPKLAALVGMSLAGEAENYARSVRLRQSWEKRRSEGKPTSNKHPYGLQLVGGRDVMIPDSGAWVLRAFEMYASGEYGMYKIAEQFRHGAPSHSWLTSKIDEKGDRIVKTRGATKWESNRVKKMLVLQRYRGSIVPPELFDKVQERLSKTPKTGSRRVREYVLSGAMSCDGCGRHVHGAATGGGFRVKTLADGTVRRYERKRVRYYECFICEYRVNAERLEQDFFDMTKSLHADDALLAKWVSMPRTGASTTAVTRKELIRLEHETTDEFVASRRDRVIDLALKAELDETEVRRQLQRIKDDVELKRGRAAAIRAQAGAEAQSKRTIVKARDLLASIKRLYSKATYEERRELLSGIAEALGGVRVSATGLRWVCQPAQNSPRKRDPSILRKPVREPASKARSIKTSSRRH